MSDCCGCSCVVVVLCCVVVVVVCGCVVLLCGCVVWLCWLCCVVVLCCCVVVLLCGLLWLLWLLWLFRTHIKVCVCAQHLRPACSYNLLEKAVHTWRLGPAQSRELPNPSPHLSRIRSPISLITTPPLVIGDGNTGKSHMTQPLPNPWTKVNHKPREVCRSCSV